ncbi:MAG: hypothetical protein FVQ83_13385 [Chloroflexi bacterium]|nr:hypothetical protein [Chloroflexota bacterium]
MLTLILELAMLAGGIYAVFSGKMPAFLIGGSKRRLNDTTARLIGGLLIMPFPFALFVAFAFNSFYGEDGLSYASIIELVVVFSAALLAVILVRVLGKPLGDVAGPGVIEGTSDLDLDESSTRIESKIAKKAQGALIYAILSITLIGIFIQPVAFFYANQAIKLIEEHGVGEQYRSQANAARIVSGLVMLLSAAFICAILF